MPPKSSVKHRFSKTSQKSIPSAPRTAASATPAKVRRPLLYTITFAAVTIMGTYYGAGLKMKSEHEQQRAKRRELPIGERIEGLLLKKKELLKMNAEVEEKLRKLDNKIHSG